MAKKHLTDDIRENVRDGTFPRTVGTTLKNVFPLGTSVGTRKADERWSLPPKRPEDIFAGAGVLLESSGALAFFGVENGESHSDYPKLSLSRTLLEECVAIGKSWSCDFSTVPDHIVELWQELWDYRKFPLNYRAYKFQPPKRKNNNFWWSVAYQLFIIADSACDGIGFSPMRPGETSNAAEYWRVQSSNIGYRPLVGAPRGSFELPSSLAAQADPDVVCVQPKALVPKVGSGTRVFSRNLALLPPRGLARTQWLIDTQPPTPGADSGLNILVIPYPFEFSDDEFKLEDMTAPMDAEPTRVFRLNQSWLREDKFNEFRDVCTTLIKGCHHTEDKRIHGIVLPELALNQKRFKEFAKLAKELAPELEFIIAGSSENCEVDPMAGNYIWIRRFEPEADGTHGTNDSYSDISQSKHHRWKLDRNQILDYELEHGRKPGLDERPHWENFAGRAREINFLAYRRNSVFCGIICEDLARSEPCHEIIRSVGPNLLFALLMDGPQIEQRWGARYASLFAADHGCAVMTVSSLALVKASQTKRSDDVNHSVLYFRAANMPEPASVQCDEVNKGVFIRLVPDRGRQDSDFRRRETIDRRTKMVVDWSIDPSYLPRVVG